MEQITPYLPSGDKGILPYYLFLVGVVAVGNSIQNLATLHYTRRIYNGLFVPNPAVSRGVDPKTEDSVTKLVPASSTGKDVEKARDQVTPLTARIFGVWTMLAGIVRIYTAYDVSSPALYQLSFLTHAVAAAHFTSEALVFKTLSPAWEQLFPLTAGFSGMIWMGMQYHNYVLS